MRRFRCPGRVPGQKWIGYAFACGDSRSDDSDGGEGGAQSGAAGGSIHENK